MSKVAAIMINYLGCLLSIYQDFWYNLSFLFFINDGWVAQT